MSVLNPVIGQIDPLIKRIYLASGIREYHPVTDIYAEMRNLRRINENYRWFKMPVSAGGNVFKGGGKYTPRYAILNFDWRIVPDDTTHALYISGEQITDDGQSGPACMDTSLLSSGTNVTIHYEPPAAEIIRSDEEFSIDPQAIAVAVWDELIADHLISGSFGLELSNSFNNIIEILGLSQKNFKMDNQIYQDLNGAKLLTSARIRTYTNSTMTTVMATYQVTAVWSETGQCTSYQVVRQ
jgi:hypothetical protein